ncbi:hypothetical protein [Thiorhodococcus fuscus]|uniref:Transposase n=1 Tax=Thiorhodococcus fuscus TaxID=527200 RepID=A0ABW4Y7C9_9GAMM
MIAWLGSLIERSFVWAESDRLTLFELLRQMSGHIARIDNDPARYIRLQTKQSIERVSRLY